MADAESPAYELQDFWDRHRGDATAPDGERGTHWHVMRRAVLGGWTLREVRDYCVREHSAISGINESDLSPWQRGHYDAYQQTIAEVDRRLAAT